jgi:hypothetical protein
MKDKSPDVSTEPGGIHDASRRALFSHPDVIRDLIRGYVDEPWVKDIDFSTLRRLPASFVTPRLRRRIADVIWTARWRERDLYIVVLVEFQRRDERYMAVRQLVYVALTLLELVEKSQLLDDDGFLPPVLPVVLYNGDRPWRSPSRLEDLFGELPSGLAELQPQFQFLLLDELRLPIDLAGPKNMMSAIAALEQGSESVDAFARAIQATDSWLAESPANLRRMFYAWVTRVLASSMESDLPLDEIDQLGELKDMMEERIARWKDQWLDEARQEGREQGRRLGEAEVLKRQLKLKFRDVPARFLARIESADDSKLLRWAERILTAESLDEVFST